MKVKIAVVEKIMLAEITDSLRRNFPTEEWTHEFEKSYIKPDGGILYLKSHNNDLYPILIIEWKNKEQMIE
jgi:hypothetical protein